MSNCICPNNKNIPQKCTDRKSEKLALANRFTASYGLLLNALNGRCLFCVDIVPAGYRLCF